MNQLLTPTPDSQGHRASVPAGMGGRVWLSGVEKSWRTRLAKFFVKTDGCWGWSGAASKSGYGKLKVAGKSMRAHRLSYEFHIGPIPDGLRVLHKCDNPPCCNPEHLFLGTQKDNVQDMILKGRRGGVCGEKHPAVKLSDQEVSHIRQLHESGSSQVCIAKEFNVTQSCVSKIVNNKQRTLSK